MDDYTLEYPTNFPQQEYREIKVHNLGHRYYIFLLSHLSSVIKVLRSGGRLLHLLCLDVLHIDLGHSVDRPEVLPDLADRLPTLGALVPLLEVDPLNVKLQVTLLAEPFATSLAGILVGVLVDLSDVDREVLEPTSADGAVLLEVEVGGVVVDPLDLTGPEHLATARHSAGDALLLLPTPVLVHQVSLHVPELSAADVTDGLLGLEVDHTEMVLEKGLDPHLFAAFTLNL